jgi:hypothetical protein
MASLEALPPELLLCIADHLQERHIHAMLLVNRRFYSVFAEHIYRNNRIYYSFSALIWGMYYGNEVVVERALLQHPSWRPRTEMGAHFRSAFILCAGYGRSGIVRMVLSNEVRRFLQPCLERAGTFARDSGFSDLADEIIRHRAIERRNSFP